MTPSTRSILSTLVKDKIKQQARERNAMTQAKELVDAVTGRVKIVQPMKRKKGDRKHFKNRMVETGS